MLKVLGIALMVMLIGCGGGMDECEQVRSLEAQWTDEVCQIDESCFCQCWNDGHKVVSDILQCYCKAPEETEIVCGGEELQKAQLCLAHEDACWSEFHEALTKTIESEICDLADAIYNTALSEKCIGHSDCCMCKCLQDGLEFDYEIQSGEYYECACKDTEIHPCEDEYLEQDRICVEHPNNCKDSAEAYFAFRCEQ